jgi:hypothetical protein
VGTLAAQRVSKGALPGTEGMNRFWADYDSMRFRSRQ